MRRNRYIAAVLALSVWLCSLGSAEAQQVVRQQVFADYILRHYKEAQHQMDKYGIPASIKIAQGLLETGAGRSTLATVNNNHFGIKCHQDWTGKKTYRTDDKRDECFRSYARWEDSYEDHSLFLKERERYQDLFTLEYGDYKGWAKGLQSAGYASNKGYANKLIKIIEDYELYALDEGALPRWIKGRSGKGGARQIPSRLSRSTYMSYGLVYVIAELDDSFEDIAQDMGISARKLAQYNDAPIDYPLNKGDVVYLQPKKSRAAKQYMNYVVQVGDSMHSIAQRYGIKLSRLYRLNKLDEEYVPEEGDTIRLR
ncbi:glucosaminidase domain-containing protein [Porphyromonas sp. COT-239 OH1446]|uniref:glucosaminidase domain-containing protein n=1 Tax=Porphyromonas sp. COT-239 OH1446 TaxID=1515613 RepID=UPI00052BE693|nr:glucosaminidase domain-containing protein [Porphyromonas sp. COT-239 OH1446]KGN72165.1 N-acetylmuramoyl-L-alanine amidase [Porphyromonas sp. COT-239 OH1446]